MRNVKTREGMEYWDKICSLKHYGFIHSPDNSRVLKAEGIGNWIDKFEAQAIVDQAQDEINRFRAERDALQQLLNQRDEQVESLKLQNQGEPVAWICHGPEGSGLVALQWSHLPTPTGLVRKIGLCLEQPAPAPAPLNYGSLDAVQRLAVCRGDVVPVSGSTCNEIREEAGQPINRPCKACGGGACIDR
ncbi:hypothetical protein [Pseudomonas sp. D2002]|uniref:hypothetical protein n=1 Tax=Pseudomonas sp. D2002 TaxID=2726980 RepID=UPI0015A35A53|nr:hypothetical protein [Pseudomonas sp. D2002]NWA81659.1 hypothetical protein [Pseudomonas sp. D2002]